MDLLSAITGSKVRADVLAALFGISARNWSSSDLGHAARRPHQLVARELERFARAGLVRVGGARRKRRYTVELDAPVSRELGRLVRQTRGRIPRIRHALVALRSRSLAWLVPGSIVAPGNPRSRPNAVLVVLTSAPKSLVRVQLANVISSDVHVHSMSIHEWVARLQKGDVLLQSARRARKVWVIGGWEDLVARERAELDSTRLLRSTIANWREELSDDWDDDWDPFAPAPGAA